MVNEPQSTVACSKYIYVYIFIQLGTFRSPEGEYFVEPLHSYQGEHYEEEHTKPHVVYRKGAPKKLTSGEDSACDTSGMMHNMISFHAYKVTTYTDAMLGQQHMYLQTQAHTCTATALVVQLLVVVL